MNLINGQTQQQILTFAPGEYVRPFGKRSVYEVKKINEDGSLSVFGGLKGHFRTFRPHQVKLVKDYPPK